MLVKGQWWSLIVIHRHYLKFKMTINDLMTILTTGNIEIGKMKLCQLAIADRISATLSDIETEDYNSNRLSQTEQ